MSGPTWLYAYTKTCVCIVYTHPTSCTGCTAHRRPKAGGGSTVAAAAAQQPIAKRMKTVAQVVGQNVPQGGTTSRTAPHVCSLHRCAAVTCTTVTVTTTLNSIGPPRGLLGPCVYDGGICCVPAASALAYHTITSAAPKQHLQHK